MAEMTDCEQEISTSLVYTEKAGYRLMRKTFKLDRVNATRSSAVDRQDAENEYNEARAEFIIAAKRLLTSCLR